MIKAIFFDLGGVLVKEAAIDQINLLSEFSNTSYENCKIIRKKYWKKLKLGLISDDEFWLGSNKYPSLKKGVLNELNIPLDKYNYIRKKSIELITLFDFTKELLDALSKKYILGIISNNSRDWGQNILQLHDIKKYFDVIIFSNNCGLAKPKLEIYELSYSMIADVLPSQVLFIDDKEKNLNSATKLGWETILFSSYEQLINEFKNLSIKEFHIN